MALARVQVAMARLFTDAEARAAFARDLIAAGRALGLDEADAASLAELTPRALERFAESLRTKRVLDARKLLPLTALSALGDGFAPEDAGRVGRTAAGDRRGRAGAGCRASARSRRRTALARRPIAI